MRRGGRAGSIALIVGLCATAAPQAGARETARATIAGVTDGDTVEAALGGDLLDVRLIGVDTPETVHPTVGVECFGKQASAFTTRALDGERVRLEFDAERRDRYGRTLAYVWRGRSLFNVTLVRKGFATVTIYPPNDRYEGRLLRAEDAARRNGRGLWSACDVPGSGGGGDPNSGGSSGGGSACDPAYPDVCIPPPPPDLDCDEVGARNFAVRSPDPHGFDGDGDGRGCET